MTDLKRFQCDYGKWNFVGMKKQRWKKNGIISTAVRFTYLSYKICLIVNHSHLRIFPALENQFLLIYITIEFSFLIFFNIIVKSFVYVCTCACTVFVKDIYLDGKLFCTRAKISFYVIETFTCGTDFCA